MAAAAFIRSAGAITATLARWRWLVSWTNSVSARTRSMPMDSTVPSVSSSGSITSKLETHEIRVLARDRIPAAGAFAAGKAVGTRCSRTATPAAKLSASACLPMPRAP